jgi:hypothetical protein
MTIYSSLHLLGIIHQINKVGKVKYLHSQLLYVYLVLNTKFPLSALVLDRLNNKVGCIGTFILLQAERPFCPFSKNNKKVALLPKAGLFYLSCQE